MAFVRKGRMKPKQKSAHPEIQTPDELIQFARERGIPTEPLNIADLAHELDIVVRYEPMEGDDSGSLIFDEETKRWIMTINSLHHPHRQRFTMAHELGHFFKHAPLSSEFRDTNFFRNAETNPMEAEANKFAAELLMPAENFENFIENVSAQAEDLAEHFQVSSIAVRIRAKQLGYSGHGL